MRKFLMLLAVAAASSSVRADIQNSPLGAVSACKDGTFSTSSGRGTCSGHGGVLRLLTADESAGRVPFTRDAPRASTSSATHQEYSEVAGWSAESPSPGTMPATGGAPILMSAFGLSVALGAFGLRRRVK